MSNQHRGLPPPAAMTLPDPGRGPPMIPPPPPPVQAPAHMHHEAQRTQWQDEGESSRSWHATRVEEERRRQEEEKTRQESLRLEQRRVEHSMLRESMQGGIPPHMVPMIFAGIGGANLANFSLEMLQQYTAQLQAAQQQLQPGQEDGRERRSINQPPAAYALPSQPPQSHPHAAGMHQQQQQQQQQQPPPPLAAHQSTFPAFQSTSPPGRRIPGAPRSSVAQSTLPRLTTGDMQINPPPSAPSSAHPLHQTQTIQQDQPASSPSIYFHHWVPPTSQADPKSGTQPQTPVTGTGASQNSDGGHHTDSPRKRKNQQAHQPPPPPSSLPTQSHSSPSFSTTSSGRKGGPAHELVRSNASPRAIPGTGQPSSRRDSGAPGTHLDFVYERGAPPSKSQQQHHHHSSHHSTAPPSPKRDARHPY
ncbi:hypothetical protein E4T43_08278 [Aureobasidium subglaciale]|nr:hypothetical protein E4T43_08278 [Aureobasidium subglaciale]